MTTLVILLAAALGVPATLALVGRAARAQAGEPRSRLLRAVVGHLLLFAVVYVGLLGWACNTALAKEGAAPAPHAAEQPPAATEAKHLSVGDGLALIGVALATGLSVLGAGYAVAVVGSAALGAITEKPELF